jgi:hypothetical protein
MRMRPLNFPTLRIAQFAALMNSDGIAFDRLLELERIVDLKALLSVRASGFWDTHYSFSTRSSRKPKNLGEHAAGLVIINTVVPILYGYGKKKGRPELRERALRFLDQLPAERNAIVKGWESLGIGVRSAYLSQALLELKQRYCRRKRCLDCAIGNAIFSGRSSRDQIENS